MKQYLKRKAFLLFALACTIAVLLGINDIDTIKGYKAVIGDDTCTVKYQNRWTGNYRVEGKQGEFSVKPTELVFIDAVAQN